MSGTFRRYAGFAAMSVKETVAYRVWFWLRLFTAAVAMTVFTYFWRAVYAGADRLAGLDLSTTLRYALLAQVVAGVGESSLLRRMSSSLREGRIAHELSRPVDLQGAEYAYAVGTWLSAAATRLPLVGLLLVYGATLPVDPLRWAVFLASFVIGASAMFCFEWLLACLAFYTTEVWGIRVAVEALAVFFGGLLVPLDLMPGWLRAVAEALPFQQIVYLPVSLLAGVTPLADAPRVLLGQLLWAAALLVLSRLAFARALRVVTVQGG